MYKGFDVTEEEYNWFIQQTAFALVQMMYQNDEELVDQLGEDDFWYNLILTTRGSTAKTFIQWLKESSSLYYFPENNDLDEAIDWLAPKNATKYTKILNKISYTHPFYGYPNTVKEDLIIILKEPMKRYLKKALEEHSLSQFADEENKIARIRVKSWVN